MTERVSVLLATRNRVRLLARSARRDQPFPCIEGACSKDMIQAIDLTFVSTPHSAACAPRQMPTNGQSAQGNKAA